MKWTLLSVPTHTTSPAPAPGPLSEPETMRQKWPIQSLPTRLGKMTKTARYQNIIYYVLNNWFSLKCHKSKKLQPNFLLPTKNKYHLSLHKTNQNLFFSAFYQPGLSVLYNSRKIDDKMMFQNKTLCRICHILFPRIPRQELWCPWERSFFCDVLC